MTPPPTNIDGTDITGATIDGQDVQEITIDGQTVFTAGPTVIQSQTPPSNLDVHYELLDGDFTDDSGSGNDGTGFGNFNFNLNGCQFSTDFADRAESPDIGLNGDDSATIGVTVIPQTTLDNSTPGRCFVGIHKGNNTYSLGYEGGDVLISANSGTAQTVRENMNLAANQAHEIYAKADGGTHSLFVNGTKVNQQNLTNGPQDANSGTLFLAANSSRVALGGTNATLRDAFAADRAIPDSDLEF
jgi:hypothetical protein